MTTQELLRSAQKAKGAMALAGRLRGQGMAVQSMRRQESRDLAEYEDMARRRGLRNILYLSGEGNAVEAIDMVNGSRDEIPLAAYM